MISVAPGAFASDGSCLMPLLLADLALAFGALFSFAFVGVNALTLLRASGAGLERLVLGTACGVFLHALIGLAIALLPAKQAAAWVLLALFWLGAATVLWLRRGDPSAGSDWKRPGMRPALAIFVLFIGACVALTHLDIRFPRDLPDGPYIFKQHTLPVKIQVMTGDLPVDNYLPFVVEEYLLRDISFAKERPIIPGQEVSNRPILMALAVVPFRAALDPPPRQNTALGRFTYVGAQWPDVSAFMEGAGFRQFLAVGIVLNALLLLGAVYVFEAHGLARLTPLALALLATSPYFLCHTIFTWPKSLAGFFLLLAVHALARRWHPAWVAGLGALGYHAHPYAVVFLASFGACYAVAAWRTRDRPSLLALGQYGVVVALALAPWFVWTQGILRIPADLVQQNIGSRDAALASQLWVRIYNVTRALVPRMLLVQNWDTDAVFRQTLLCLPGVLGLFTPAAYHACARDFGEASRRRTILYGVLLPALLLTAAFGYPASPLRHGLQSTCVWLLLLGVAGAARVSRRLALGLLVAQVVLQIALLMAYGRSLGMAG